MNPVEEVLAQAQRLEPGVVEKVFRRYGKPLAIALPAPTAEVTIDAGVLRAVNIRMPVDVIGNDFFVLEVEGEALAIPGPLFAAAVAALLREV